MNLAAKYLRAPDGVLGGSKMNSVSSRVAFARLASKGANCARTVGLGIALALLLSAALASAGAARAEGNKEWLEQAFRTPAPTRSFDQPSRLGAALPAGERSRRQRSGHVRLASLGSIPTAAPTGSLSGGGGIRWAANAGCLPGSLQAVIAHVAANFGAVTVNSTCRSQSHNRQVGGARRSYHLSSQAADFRVRGNVGATLAYLRGTVSGLKHYGGGLFHIDTGPRRPM